MLALLITTAATVKDTGWLKAEGDGNVYLAGQGHLTMEGRGSLWYAELPEKGRVKAEEIEKEWKFRSGIGHFEVDGRFIVVALGKDLKIEATGRGRGHFIGKGTWETNSRKGTWGPRPKPVIYGARAELRAKDKDKHKDKK